jgi:hypothetical protein
VRFDRQDRKTESCVPKTTGSVDRATRAWPNEVTTGNKESAPPLEMRVMTRERRVDVELADDLPTYTSHSGKFMLKLIAAWIAMGFRRPEITLGKTVRRGQ